MGYVISIIMFVAMYAIMFFGFGFILEFLGTSFPSVAPLLQNNEVAAGIFLIIGILMNMPFPICAIIGGIYGAFAVTPWYTPALQVIILEIAWFLLNLFFTLVMGTSIGTFSVATKLLDKLEWINFRGAIGRKQFFIRLLIIFVTMILIGLLAVMIYNEITVF